MRPFFSMPCRWLFLLLLPAFVLVVPAYAGNISFNLSITGNRLTLSNQGDSPAFDPVVMRLLDNGHWETLPSAAGTVIPVELKPQANAELIWVERPAPPSAVSLETLRPIMVRFFDQAGSGFGQISFFNQPQTAGNDQLLDAGYENGKLHIAPPKNAALKASWLVWPQEEGIAALTDRLTPSQPQPDAVRIQWSADSKEQSLDLGRGMPTAFLLHETPQGLRLQVVPTGRAPGRQQRSAWLDHGERLRNAAMVALLAGLAMLAWHMAANRQRQSIHSS